MDLARLIEALSRPAAYPEAVAEVQVRQTHISVVFLAGGHAYKVKKPVAPGFLDFRTLEDRRHFCAEEVRLNRRLAPDVYLGVVPVTREGDGLRFGGGGEAVEWAVRMRRLPEGATLLSRLRRGEVGAAQLEYLARRVAAFHASAEAGPRIAALARWEEVARNLCANLPDHAADGGGLLSGPVRERLGARLEESLARLAPLIESRAGRGVPRDTHGDLRLEHVYLFPDRAPPDDLIVIDCIEFNERFRFADPVADMAFVVMDLAFEGRRDLARAFADAYFRAAGDDEGRQLLPMYTAYRSMVRARVGGLKCAEAEIPEGERAAARTRARAHWLVALGELEEADRKPCLVLVGGLPGSGKSTLARGLAGLAPFHVLRSDVVRKELAGAAAAEIYTPEWTDRTYAECLRRAEELLFEGERVLVDATFREERWRRAFLEAAGRAGVPAALLLCRADPGVARARIERRRGDASDAGWPAYLSLSREWEEIGDFARPYFHEVATDGSESQTLARARSILQAAGLMAGSGAAPAGGAGG
jgi:aminoglycoside phosphotransferase family enzyme/predicted kinase